MLVDPKVNINQNQRRIIKEMSIIMRGKVSRIVNKVVCEGKSIMQSIFVLIQGQDRLRQ